MSLNIDIDDINEVLLADGWYSVHDQSFVLDSYEYMWQGDAVHGGGESGICSTGFSFKVDNGTKITGPLTAVLAVRTGTSVR